jgi:hypothetical protein
MKVLRMVMVLALVAVLYAVRLVLLAMWWVAYAYLLPAVIATHRDYPKAGRIYWVCGLTGWLVLPWLASLVFVLVFTKPQPADDMLFHWS